MFAKCFANFSDRVNILLDHETIFYMQEKPWNFIYECLTKKLFFSGENLRNYLLCRRNVGNQFPAGSSASEPHTPNWRGQYCEFYFLVMQKGNYAEWIDKVTGLTRLKIIKACRMMIGCMMAKGRMGIWTLGFKLCAPKLVMGKVPKKISGNIMYVIFPKMWHIFPYIYFLCMLFQMWWETVLWNILLPRRNTFLELLRIWWES